MDYSENRIDIKHLSKLGYNFQKNQEQDHPNEASLPLYTLVENFEKRIISHILHKHRGNKTKTAKELGVSIRTLYYKMEKYGL